MRPVFSFAVLIVFSFLPNLIYAGDNKHLSRIAFGSCAQQERKQPIWHSIAAAKPQLFLFVGDNIYGDTEDMRVMRAKYAKLAAKPGYRQLLKFCPVLATWDDHDYGVNDGGEEYPKRVESQKVFLDFFGAPANDPRRSRPGIYHAKMYGPADSRVQVIMLDTRYFRSKLRRRPRSVRGQGPYIGDSSPNKTMLGAAQWAWLAKELRKPAKLRIVVSSVQVVPEDHGWEKWMNFPRERAKLFKLLGETKAEGVLFLSGDRHLAELSQMDAGVGYPIYDLTSSGLNQAFKRWRPQEKNRHRIATMNFGDNFGLILIDWKRDDPLVRLQIRDEDGDVVIQHKIRLSVLKRGVLTVGSSRAKLTDGQLLTPEIIKKNLKKRCTVHMRVRNTGSSSKAQLVFLNSARNRFSEENFTVVLNQGVQMQLKRNGILNAQEHFLNKNIRVTGTLSEFGGQPQIIVSGADDISIDTK